jgi:Asp-tRNA(Asn)/Glu-tRNA(Gln) amidotransferase A subunit family amidase
VLQRRELIRLAGLAALAHRSSGAARPLESLGEWLHANSRAREEGVQLCLQRIREMDPSIQAWVQVGPQAPTGQGRLSGIPFGVKDIIDTEDFPTEFGSPIYKGRRAGSDAAIVRDLRRRGGVLLGKTQTAAFAYRMPAPTRNPRNLEHTPGGSSSGSAAAVAAGMAPFAIGTQTRGSVLRPASYCGVTGFKPSYGLLSTEGVLPLAQSLDTLGFFTHTATDMLLLWECLGNMRGREENLIAGVPEPLPLVEPAMDGAFRNALAVLRRAGVSIQAVQITPMLDELDQASTLVMTYEGARFHERRFREHGPRLDRLADLVREGLEIPDAKYRETTQFISRCKERIAEIYRATPIILTPSATGPAPLGLASTGDPRMNSPWTALGTPAVSIPMPIRNGLPLGLQITAGHGQDAKVLRAAVRLEGILRSAAGSTEPRP